MSKKTITIKVPGGLPDGWECVGYGKPVVGETMHHSGIGWIESVGKNYNLIHLIARRTETPADWANKQPRLGALIEFLHEGQDLRLCTSGKHLIDEGDNVITIRAEKCPENMQFKYIKPQNGKWTNA